MKTLKILVILAASAMLLGLTQCKKNVETINPTSHGGVHVTLRVDNDDRHSVNTTQGSHYGEVTFSENDELYVGNGGQFVGTLYYHNGQFEGEIGVDDEPPYAPIPLTNGENLHFYYTGGYKYFDGMSEDEGHVYLHFNMSDQRSNLPVFSYGNTGNVVYDETATTHDYECMLLNKCALVKFDLSTNTSDDMVIYGMCSEVKFTFENVDDNVFVPTGKRDPITVNSRGTNNYEKWAILLPQAKVDDATVKIGNTMYLDAVDVPAITNNALLTAQVSTATPYVPAFSIGNGNRISFAPGNLQYQASTDTWRFAEHQWDYVGGEGGKDEKVHYGNVPGSTNEDASATYEGWIDLYMWATSNWDNTSVDPYSIFYHPWSDRSDGTAPDYVYNHLGIGPSLDNPYGPDIMGTHYDWGVHNAIYNPSTNNTEAAGTWRTPTSDEMNYLLTQRTDAASLRGFGQVDGVRGLFLLPDGWILPQGLTFSSTGIDNSYTITEWLSMEGNGAVFLPCGGAYRDRGDKVGKNTDGLYWLADHYEELDGAKDSPEPSDEAYAWGFWLYNEEEDSKEWTYDVGYGDTYRYEHVAVRLVKDVQ